MPIGRKPLPEQLTGGPFTAREAAHCGVTPAVLRGRGVQRIDRGLYLDESIDLTLAQRLIAYLKVLPRGCTAVDGVTALQCWDVDVGTRSPYRFVTTAAYRSTRTDVRVRRTRELPERRGPFLRVVPALVAARTELSLVDLVVAADWVVRSKRATLAQVQKALATTTGRHCRRARRASQLVRERVDSPQETRLRLVLVFAGLPEPECNIDLGDEWFFIGRVDLFLREWNIALEYEGDHHRTSPAVFAADLKRYEQLAAAGVLVIRITKTDLPQPRDVIRRVHAALVARGYDGPEPVFGTEWVEAFETRR